MRDRFNRDTVAILRRMVSNIVLPIKKVFSLVETKINIEIKDERRTFVGKLIAVDEYMNVHIEEAIECIPGEADKLHNALVIRGNNILSIAPAA
jgi:small nuclear ribonucleoprotein (snRNP)-like protein